jgi:LSD1 subclass zinc finger protein
MKKGRNTAAVLGNDDELDDMELSDGECQDRTLILKAVPRSRKVQLMAQGAKEIRCACCGEIRSIAGAEESEEGWICEDCLPHMQQESKHGEQRGRPHRRRGNHPEGRMIVRL